MKLAKYCGSVFRDFGDSDADIQQAKSLLAARIIGILDDRHITVRAAEKLKPLRPIHTACMEMGSESRWDRLLKRSLRRFGFTKSSKDVASPQIG